jgi:hypothetical protein
MRQLIEIRYDIHTALERLYSLKTKAAKAKQVLKLKALRNEGFEAMQSVFNEGEEITLDRPVNCTNAFGGGGWGCRGTVKIQQVSSTSLVVACGNESLEIELLEDWKCWGSDSFWAFETVLKERGQDIGFAAREHAIKYITRSLRGALSCRNSRSSVNHNERLRDSKHFQQRLHNMIEALRDLKLQQFKANVESITHENILAYRATKAVSRE